MVWYCIISAILLYCFEIIGRYILYKLKINNFRCSFGVGIILFLAYSYITTSLISAFNGSFLLVSIIYTIFFVAVFVLVVKEKNKISFEINITNVVLLVMFELIMLYFAYNTMLGDLNGFDSTYYLNIVTSNIKSNNMNIGYYYNAVKPATVGAQYSFQSFYSIASFFSYIFSYVINVFHNTYYQTVYIWVFQIIFNAFFFSLIINSIYLTKIKNRNIFTILALLFFVLVYGRLYYFNVFGFFGNTYRIIVIGYTVLFLYLLTTLQKENNMMMLFICSLIALAAVSSSGLFIDIFIMFGAYFILCNKYNNIFKYYGFALLFILPNLLYTSVHINIEISILISVAISAMLYIFNDSINKILSKKESLIIIFALSFAFMFFSSLSVTKNILDFSSFFSNYSETADMTLNYFNLNTSKNLLYLKIFILLLLISTLLSVNKEQILRFVWILIICIFNPFCSAFINKILIVYFRAFDIIINPFTIILFIDYLLKIFNDNKIFKIVLYLIMIFITIQNNPTKPLYYHDSFKPRNEFKKNIFDEYNGEFKMSQNEIDVINKMYDDILYKNIEEPYIISSNLLTQSLIPNGKYLFNRNKHNECPYTSNNERQLFAIFYPERYLGDHLEGVTPDYNNMKQYIKDAKIDYLVVDKTKEYFDENNNTYSYLYYKVLDNFYPMYENDRFVVICCSEQ